MFYAFQELMHQVALLPLAVMLVSLRWRVFGWRRWVLAGSFYISWSMDSTDVATGADAAFITRYGNPLQIGIVLVAIVKERAALAVLLAGLIVLATASSLQGVTTREIVVPCVGGFAIGVYTWGSEKDGIRSGLLVHYGLGAFAWLAWSFFASETTWMAFTSWFSYQGTRLAGILLITAAMVQRARQPRIGLV